MPERVFRWRSLSLLSRSAPLFAASILLFLVSAPAEEQPKSVEHPESSAAELAAYDAKIAPADREYWAFQPVKNTPVPAVRGTDWPRNPIDNFILAKLEEKGWQPAEATTPQALLRRVHLDVVGLPPTLAEQKTFLADASPQSYEQDCRPSAG
jgi:hypothetical protein